MNLVGLYAWQSGDSKALDRLRVGRARDETNCRLAQENLRSTWVFDRLWAKFELVSRKHAKYGLRHTHDVQIWVFVVPFDNLMGKGSCR